MKKKFKIIIPIVLIVLVILSIVIYALIKDNKIIFYSYKKHYSMLTNDYPEIDVVIYTNKDDNEYLDINKIENSSIFNEVDYYTTSITNIMKLDKKKKINNEEYIQYKISLKFDFIIDDIFWINEAKLEIKYFSGEKLHLNIGNICFEKINYSHYIGVDKVQSICNDLGNLESLVAVKVSFTNNTDDQITIKSIKTISNTVHVNNDFVVCKDYNYDLEHTIDVNQLFGSNYNLYKNSTNSLNPIDFDQNTAKDIIIPLTYTKKEFVDSIGFVIELEINNEIYYQLINPYTLFSTSNLDYVLYEYEVTKI